MDGVRPECIVGGIRFGPWLEQDASAKIHDLINGVDGVLGPFWPPVAVRVTEGFIIGMVCKNMTGDRLVEGEGVGGLVGLGLGIWTRYQ